MNTILERINSMGSAFVSIQTRSAGGLLLETKLEQFHGGCETMIWKHPKIDNIMHLLHKSLVLQPQAYTGMSREAGKQLICVP